MTVAPRFAAAGASAVEVSPPALNSAMSTPSNASGVAWRTVWTVPATSTSVPALRSLASSRSSVNGKARSTSRRVIVLPTRPVAPTTATVRGFAITLGMAPLWS